MSNSQGSQRSKAAPAQQAMQRIRGGRRMRVASWKPAMKGGCGYGSAIDCHTMHAGGNLGLHGTTTATKETSHTHAPIVYCSM